MRVRDEQLLMKYSLVWQSNNRRLTLFMTLHMRDQMGFVSSSYFLLTPNQHPTHLKPQKGFRVKPDIFV